MTTPTLYAPRDRAKWPLSASGLSRLALTNPDIEVRCYAPQGSDLQTPHDRDELYFVISGTGTFERGAERVAFRAGDMLFAAAGETHRFTDFSSDFVTWVLFYGAKTA
jgi:mannose-6-phosphate isomerase-like protein (cupin superfamily)